MGNMFYNKRKIPTQKQINDIRKEVDSITPSGGAIATHDTLGSVIVGDSISVTEEGVINVDNVDVQDATEDTKGIAKLYNTVQENKTDGAPSSNAVYNAIKGLEKFAGIYKVSTDLPTEGITEGWWAAVLSANGFPAEVYRYDGTAWEDTEETWEPDSAATAAVEEAKEEALDEIESESTRIIAQTTTLLTFKPDAGDDPQECALLIKPDVILLTLHGIVTDGTNPIANKTVSVGLWSTTTNANGEYSNFQIPAGKWAVACQNYYENEVEFYTDGEKNITLTELPTRAVTIHLVGSTYGDAMPDTVITCDSGETATTNEYGAATFSAIHDGEHTFTVNEDGKEGTRTFKVMNSPSMSKKCMECTGDDVFEDDDVILSANEEDAELECYNVPLYNAITTAIAALANEGQRITLAAAKARTESVSFYNNTSITDATQLKFFTNLKFTESNALRGMTNLNRIVITGQFGNGSSPSLFYNNGTVTYFSLWKAKVYGGSRSSGATWTGSTVITHFVTNPNMPYLKYGQEWGGRIDMDDLVTSGNLISLQQFFQSVGATATTRIGKGINTSNVTTFSSFITNNSNMVNLYFDGEFDVSKVTSFNNFIGGATGGYAATKLENVYGKLKNVSADISFAACSKLKKASIENIITWLHVYEPNSDTRTITFHATAKTTYGGADVLASDLAAIGWKLA